jgi:hypothetical protein
MNNNCPKVSAKPDSAEDTETIINPALKVNRSPIRSINLAAKGADTTRISAKIEITVLAANALTPNERPNSGIVGATIPKPKATQKEIMASTQIAGGRSLNLASAAVLLLNNVSLIILV